MRDDWSALFFGVGIGFMLACFILKPLKEVDRGGTGADRSG